MNTNTKIPNYHKMLFEKALQLRLSCMLPAADAVAKYTKSDTFRNMGRAAISLLRPGGYAITSWTVLSCCCQISLCCLSRSIIEKQRLLVFWVGMQIILLPFVPYKTCLLMSHIVTSDLWHCYISHMMLVLQVFDTTTSLNKAFLCWFLWEHLRTRVLI